MLACSEYWLSPKQSAVAGTSQPLTAPATGSPRSTLISAIVMCLQTLSPKRRISAKPAATSHALAAE
jgi:hypothetical protein